jgi:hypothetical protein
MIRARFFFASTVWVVCAGCSSIQSQNIKTAGMQAILRVWADGTGQSTATAQLNVDNNPTDFVDLSGGDAFVASSGGQSRTMSRIDLLGAISYEASFSALDKGGTTYTIALDRTTDVSAPSSTCVMPSQFTITAPTSSGTFSRANDDLVVTYSGSGTQDPMTWSAGGDCVQGMVGGTVSNDAGTFTIARGTLVPKNPSPQTPTTCQAHVTLTRSRAGQLDPHYGSGGGITAEQVRTVTFSSTP